MRYHFRSFGTTLLSAQLNSIPLIPLLITCYRNAFSRNITTGALLLPESFQVLFTSPRFRDLCHSFLRYWFTDRLLVYAVILDVPYRNRSRPLVQPGARYGTYHPSCQVTAPFTAANRIHSGCSCHYWDLGCNFFSYGEIRECFPSSPNNLKIQ